MERSFLQEDSGAFRRLQIASGHTAFAAYHAAPAVVNASALLRKNADDTYDAAPRETYKAPMVCTTAPPMENSASSVATRKCTNAIPSAVAVMPLRTQFKYAFSTARCRLCADARVGSAELAAGAAPEGRGVDDSRGGVASLGVPVLLEPWRALARRDRAARSAAREAVGAAAAEELYACGCVRAIAPVWTNTALAGLGTRGGGPAREIRATSRVATAASLRRDMAARSARDAAGRSDTSFGCSWYMK